MSRMKTKTKMKLQKRFNDIFDLRFKFSVYFSQIQLKFADKLQILTGAKEAIDQCVWISCTAKVFPESHVQLTIDWR